MALGLFDQFLSPILFGVPLIAIALMAPWALSHGPQLRLCVNRSLGLESQFYKSFLSHLFMSMNQPGHKWALVLTSLAAMLMSLNLLGLLPYTFTPTTQLSMNMGLAIPFWAGTVITGFRTQPTHTLAHFLPEGTPVPLIPLLIIIETISLFMRPLALGVRLTANITAGHLLMQLISSAMIALLPFSAILSTATAILLFLLTMLELAVAMIQAYVFVLLISLYLQENV